MERKILLDNGGRRSGADRRRFSYALHIPEGRSSKDRRKGLDRRNQQRKEIKSKRRGSRSKPFEEALRPATPHFRFKKDLIFYLNSSRAAPIKGDLLFAPTPNGSGSQPQRSADKSSVSDPVRRDFRVTTTSNGKFKFKI